MNLTQRFNNALNAVKASPGLAGAPFVGVNDPRYTSFQGIMNPDHMVHSAMGRIEIAKRAVWVYACVVARANVMKDIPLKLYTRDERGVKDEVRDHPIVELLQDVNPIKDTPATIRTATEQSLCIHGGYTWKKVRNNAGVVKEIYGIPWQYIRIIPNAIWIDEFQVEYSNQRGARMIESYKPSDIVYFRYPDLDGGVGALSPLSVAIDTTKADLGIIEGQNALIRNAARPSMVITVQNKMNDSDYARENERVQSAYAGASNAGKIMLIDNAQDTKVQPIQLTPRDLEWINQHRAHIKDICAAFGVTPGMVGEFAEASRLANAGAMHRFYGETFVRPELQMWEDALNWQLLWTEDWGHGVGWERSQGMFLEHDLAGVSMFREDENARSKRAQTAFMTGASIDETLQMNGLNPVGGVVGDLRLVPSNLVPLSQIANVPPGDDETSPMETNAEHSAEMGKKPALVRHEESKTESSSAYTDVSEKDNMEFAKAKLEEIRKYKKWARKNQGGNFKFYYLDENEQSEVTGRVSPALEDEIKSTLAKVNESVKPGIGEGDLEKILSEIRTLFSKSVRLPEIQINMPPQEPPVINVQKSDPIINVNVDTAPLTSAMKAWGQPEVVVNVPQQEPPVVNVTPEVKVEVNPTPVNVNVEPTPVTVNVSPTPVTIENQVTPVNVTKEKGDEEIVVKRGKDGRIESLTKRSK